MIIGGYISFQILNIYNDNQWSDYNEFLGDGGYDGDFSYGIRPVITLKPGVLENSSGSGTEEDPYIIK